MRVLHILNHTRRCNGNVHAAVDLACAQSRLGHDVVVVSDGGELDAVLQAQNVESIKLAHEKRPLTIASSTFKLRRILHRWHPDVVHAHMMTSALMAWPVCRLAGVPLITTVHNAFQTSAILMGIGTRMIAVSAAVARSMQARGVPASRIVVVLNGTGGVARLAEQDRTPHDLSSPSILFVGGLHPRKGLPDLVAAFETVHARHPDARLYVVGGGPFLDVYQADVSTRACAPAVTFLGAQDDVLRYMRGADIFVLPSLADPAPLVLSEAREAGCAIVASDVDGIPEMLDNGQAGLLTPPGQPERLSQILCMLLDSPEQLAAWRCKSRANLDFFHIDRVTRETLEVYADALRQRRRYVPSHAARRAS